MRPYTQKQLRQFAAKLKAEQEKLEPHLTYEQMKKVLNYQYDNSVTKILDKLVANGLAKRIEFGEGKNRYRIL